MVRIVINSSVRSGFQQAQFDLPNHNGNGYAAGDQIDAKIFENLGPIKVKDRVHYSDEKLLIVYCEGSEFLQRFLVEKYPDIQCMPDSAQLPPQDWKSL